MWETDNKEPRKVSADERRVMIVDEVNSRGLRLQITGPGVNAAVSLADGTVSGSGLTAQQVQLEQQNIAIPLGTLLGWQLLAGRGPEVTMRAVPTGFASSEFTTRLESAGVNQTLLMGCIDFHLEISAILPGFSSTETVRDEVCVFQTLVVGEVPQVYASMEQNPAQ